MKLKNLPLLATLLGTTAASAQLTNTFNTTSDLTSDFTQQSTGASWTFASSGGNPGGYAASSGDNAFATGVIPWSLDTSASQTFTFSGDFLVAAGGSATGRRALVFGFSNSNSISYAGGGLLEDVSMIAGLYTGSHDNVNGTTNFRYIAQNGSTNSGLNLTVGTNNDLDHGTWYKMENVWTYDQSADSFDVQMVIKSADGLSTIRSFELLSDFSNPFGANPTLYSFFGGRNTLTGGIGGLDNFTSPSAQAIPEPSTYVLITGLLSLGLIAYRRRK